MIRLERGRESGWSTTALRAHTYSGMTLPALSTSCSLRVCLMLHGGVYRLYIGHDGCCFCVVLSWFDVFVSGEAK